MAANNIITVEEQRYNVIKNMLDGSVNQLCQQFRRLWKEETGTELDDTTLQKNSSVLRQRKFNYLRQPLTSIFTDYMKLEDCKISLLTTSLLKFRKLAKYENEQKGVDFIHKLNEELDNNSVKKISVEDYPSKMEETQTSLERLGMEKKELDDLVYSALRRRYPNGSKAELWFDYQARDFTFNEKKLEAYKRSIQAGGQARKKNGAKELLDFVLESYFYEKNTDVVKILKNIKHVAEMDIKSPGKMTLYKCNAGVAEAQKFVGRFLIKEDILFDPKQAAVWLEKGMENGDEWSARLIGLMYAAGDGIKRDPQMGEMCFKESLNLKHAPAAKCLVEFYLKDMEIEKVKKFYRIWIGIEDSQLSLVMPEEKFHTCLEDRCHLRGMVERQVNQFEIYEGLDKIGLTFLQRLCRALGYLHEEIEEVEIILDECVFVTHTPHCFAPAICPEADEKFEADGSNGTETVRQIMVHVLNKYCILLQLLEKKENFSEKEKLEVLDLFYEIIHRGLRFVSRYHFRKADKIVKVFEDLRKIENYEKEGVDDEKLRVCYAASILLSKGDDEADFGKFLGDGITRYPNNWIYYSVLCQFWGKKRQWHRAQFFAEIGLQKDANNVELMFLEAVSFSFLNADTKLDKCVEKFRKIIDLAPKDDPNVPDAWFAIAGLYLEKLEKEIETIVPFRLFKFREMKLIEAIFRRGVAAEKYRLFYFLPYKMSIVRLKVELSLYLWKGDNKQTERAAQTSLANEQVTPVQPKMTVLDRKMYLKSPTRKGLIKLHRQTVKAKMEDIFQEIEKPDENEEYVDPPKLQESLAEGLSSLKVITLIEMPPTVEHIFKDRLLQLTILVEPFVNLGFLATVAEDNDRDVIRVHVYNFENEETKFSVGSRIAVINPYLSMTKQDSFSCIRIDDLRCVIFQRKVRNMCGFCGDGNSTHHCSKCKRKYCSKECEDLDVERHFHNLNCSDIVK